MKSALSAAASVKRRVIAKRRAAVSAAKGSGDAKAEILAAAARIIAEQGYHGMSMRELARGTGRALASFYSHYASKEDVLFALQTDAFETLIASAESALADVAAPVARLYCFILNHVRYVAGHRDVMHVLVHEAAALPPTRRRTVRALKERYFGIAKQLVEDILVEGCENPRARSSGKADPSEVERTTDAIFGMLNWTYGWYDSRRHGQPQDVARTIHRIALCGMVARCPHRPVQEEMDEHLESLVLPDLIRRRDTGGANR